MVQSKKWMIESYNNKWNETNRCMNQHWGFAESRIQFDISAPKGIQKVVQQILVLEENKLLVIMDWMVEAAQGSQSMHMNNCANNYCSLTY